LIDHSTPDQGSKDKGRVSHVKKGNVFFGKGMMAAILGIVALLVIIVMMTTGGVSGGNTVPAQQCADKTLKYVNNNLVQPGSTAAFVSVTETKGIYELKVNYQAQNISLYATKDCSVLFTKAMSMDGAPPTPVPTRTPVKNTRPTVDLFVMAFCPYGTQAETVMRPVVDLLGLKADIRVHYITTVKGTSIGSVDSLHGPVEAKEDLYQICLMRSQPARYWEYLGLFNEQCYPKWQDASALESCRKNVTDTLGIDTASVQTCMSGSEGIALLKADETESNKYSASASPTLIINGVEYDGARTPEAYKQAICASFDTPPSECNTTLSSASVASSGGGCG
jgi:hypothetical protein